MARKLIVLIAGCWLSTILATAQEEKPKIDIDRMMETLSPSLGMETPRATTEWDEGTLISVRIAQGNQNQTTTFQIYNQTNMQMTVVADEKGQPSSEQIMLIDGRWLAAKHLNVPKGYEIDALDRNLLTLKLVLYLLSAAIPGGPSNVRNRSTLTVEEKAHSFVVATISANAPVQAPWQLEATVDPVGPNKWSFDLLLKAKRPDLPMHLAGNWEKSSPPPTLAMDTPLADWQLYSIGPVKIRDGNMMRIDFQATPLDRQPKTIGELKSMRHK